MEQDWFEMKALMKKQFANPVWIPLRAIQKVSAAGEVGRLGFKEEFFGAGTVLVPTSEKESVEKLDWMDIGISHDHGPYVQDGRYISSDIYEHYDGSANGLHLVLQQRTTSGEAREWHLHQDFVLAFRLKRDGDIWVSPGEDYVEVARLKRDGDGDPILLKVKAEHLRDYMCARDMGLYITSYRQRTEVVADTSHIQWKNNPEKIESDGTRWEGRTDAIHEGGFPFGESTQVLHVSRTDVDPEEDIPTFDLPESSDSLESRSWTVQQKGRKLFRVEGELWKNEWIEPGKHSPRIRGDKLSPTVYFITDASGSRENRETLKEGRRWLWFRPDVIMALAHRRGGFLKWYTRDTGQVSASPAYGVHFGVNKLGMITVYAKDIALLPYRQQEIWSGHNVAPEGGVSEELLASQMRATPANTQAPEAFLPKGVALLNDISQRRFGFLLFRAHEKYHTVLAQTHRFRAIDQGGLFSLAKDVARLTADSIDKSALQKIVSPPPGESWGSLKSSEVVLAQHVAKDRARLLLTPLEGARQLRHGDAHLPSSDIEEAYEMVGINRDQPPVFQGYSLLQSCVSSLFSIAKVLAGRDAEARS